MTDTRKKKVTILAAAIVLMSVGGVAVAFWTAGGSGTGSASTGSTTPIVVKQTSTVSNLRPGGQPQTLSGNFDNANEGPIRVNNVVVSIQGVTKAQGVNGNCDASDYTLTDATMTVNQQVQVGNGQGTWSGARISFNNKNDVNQDGCKGATVNLAYSAN